MPRAKGNDLCEIFGYTPDDTSDNARKQWKSQECPFVGGVCIKHSHPQDGKVVVYGTCSVTNKVRGVAEDIIICPQRLYANSYESLRSVVNDAIGITLPIYMAHEYTSFKANKALPDEYVVMLGRNSGREISLSNAGFITLSLDWVMVHVKAGEIQLAVPCEVQSIDTTGNYYANWYAYSHELDVIPDSKHGMNWANVWKRLIPQLILKGSVASTSKLCKKGIYFIVPDRVYVQFERLMGQIADFENADEGILTVMTYDLDAEVANGSIRQLKPRRTMRMLVTEFAKAFASGSQLPLGTQLDTKVVEILGSL
jgi:hypothetical protein